MNTSTRRFDIDWVRVIAIGLLLVYHVAIGFQPWAIMIGFIGSEKTWPELWIPMAMLNIWRIPLLFFVSGMGVFFAIQNRNWIALLKERAMRILLPYIFGALVIFPLTLLIWLNANHLSLKYEPNPGHLWFLGNIFAYVVLLSPCFIYLRNHPSGTIARFITKVFGTPIGIIIVIAGLSAEAYIIRPVPYELYAMTYHGFFLGLLAFLFGFCFVFSGDSFWKMISKVKWILLIAALIFFIVRMVYFKMNYPFYLLVMESQCWILSVLAFGHRYLNRPSAALTYLSEAAYPIYIVHMTVLYVGSVLIFKLNVDAWMQFIMLFLFTAGGCFVLYELIRRVSWLRPLFGLKLGKSTSKSGRAIAMSHL